MVKAVFRSKWWLALLVILAFMLVLAAPAYADTGVSVTVLDSHSNPIAGVLVQFSQNNFSTYVSATTDTNGVANKTVADGTWKVRANYHNTTAIQTLDTGVSSSLTFYTSECQAQVNKHDGTVFPGVLVKFSNSNGFGVYVSASTDGTGLATAELFPSIVYVRASISGTSADQSLALAGDSTSSGESSQVTFYTSESVVQVQDCSGSPKIEGARVQFFNDGTHGTYVSAYTDVNGLTQTELFPGSHDAQASINDTAQIKTYSLAGDGKTSGQSSAVTFNPTKVNLSYSGPVQYLVGYYHSPIASPFYMFPATVHFRFGGAGGYETDLDIASCSFAESIAAVHLTDSHNNGLAGGTAQYYDGGWKSIPGSTDANGWLYCEIPGAKTNVSFRMSWAGATQQKTQNIALDSVVEFQTTEVSMKLLDSHGAELAGDGQYYASGWKTFGTTQTTATMELLPVNYPFRVSYGGASMQKSQNVGDDPIVIFNTVEVSMKLLDSHGAELAGDGQYYASGWKTFGTTQTTATMELLPVNYPFRVSYGGASMQKSQNVGDDPIVIFNTVEVSMKLLDSHGAELAGDGQYYASGWKTFGTTQTTATMELLPVNYPFRVSYGGASMQKSQNVGDDPIVIFNTVEVSMKLLDSHGAELAGDGQYYASGWKTFGTTQTTATMELLPVNYPFRVSYGGASMQKSQNVGDDPIVIFNTVEVSMKLLDSHGRNWRAMASTTRPVGRPSAPPRPRPPWSCSRSTTPSG